MTGVQTCALPISGTKRGKTWEEHVDAKTPTKDSAKEVKRKTPTKDSSKSTRRNSKKKPLSSTQEEEDSECKVTQENSPTPRVIPQPVYYLGLNWGTENVDTFMLAFIRRVQNVASDGHCGYRALSVLMGWTE